MSKAQDWANQGGTWQQNRPRFESPHLLGSVTNDGKLEVQVSRDWLMDQRGYDPEIALAFARWIIETFGD